MIDEIQCNGCGTIRKWNGSECLTVCECMKTELPWPERVAMLSVNPDAASSGDVAQLASDLMNCHQQDRLKTHEVNVLVKENRKLLKQFSASQQALEDAVENILSRGGHEEWPIIKRLRGALLTYQETLCKACGCTIDVHGCGCNPHDA